ncbi:MAG: TonB-dependent receptor, partial [Sphingobacteriales bacterium]
MPGFLIKYCFAVSLLVIGFFPVGKVAAQTISDTLKEAEIRADKPRMISADEKLQVFSPGQTIRAIDSTVLQQYGHQSAATVLAEQSAVFIKSFGFNGLATLNFRGASAAQSQVIWNGVPVNNAAMGVADISTLPAGMIHRMNIVYGGASSLLGAGNVGGALVMESEAPVFDTSSTVEISASGGSFSQAAGGIRLKKQNSRYYVSAHAIIQAGVNDFTFRNSQGFNQRTVNASMKGFATAVQAARNFGRSGVLRVLVWQQQYDRHIPAALFESYSVKERKDWSLKLLTEWKKEHKAGTTYIKLAGLRDELDYSDAAVALYSHNISSAVYFEPGVVRKIKNADLLLFFPVQAGFSPLDGQTKKQFRYAVAGAVKLRPATNLQVSASGRLELTDGKVYMLPGVNGIIAIGRKVHVRANLQRSWRVPTLNELYYDPGGNAILKPEKGWSAETGLSFSARKKGWKTEHDLTGYYRDIRDWIYWLGGAVWTPHNLSRVASRGLEAESKLSCVQGQLKMELNGIFSYTVATSVESYIPGDGSIGKQLPNTPKTSGLLRFKISFRQWQINYAQVFTGGRYINTDESGWLPGYNTGSLFAARDINNGKNHFFRFSFQAGNLFDADYT